MDMKRVFMKTTATICLVLCLLVVSTQSASAQLLAMGAKAGATRADMFVTLSGNEVDSETRGSFHVGGVVSLALTSLFSLQFEGQFIGKGFDTITEADELTPSAKLFYFELPLLGVLTVPIGSDGIVAPRLFAGPTFALRISCTVSGAEGVESDCGADVTEQLDVGFMLGGGLKFGRGRGGITFDVAYDYGFSNTNTSDVEATLKNRVLLFSVGFLAPII